MQYETWDPDTDKVLFDSPFIGEGEGVSGSVTAPLVAWILATSNWDDAGIWVDTALWID